MYSLGSSFRHNFHFCSSSKCRALVPNFARLARQNCACAVDARLLRMCGRRDSNGWTAVVTTMYILIFSYFQIRFSDPSLREGRRRWGSKIERFLLMMKIHDLSSSCEKCEKSVLTRRKSIMWSTKQLQSELEIALYVKNDNSREGISSGIMCSTMNFRLHVKLRDGISSDIMCSTMNTKCSVCEKCEMTRRNFVRHHVLYHEL